MSRLDDHQELVKDYIPRFRLLMYTIGLSLILFSGRLIYLQIIKGKELKQFSEKNRIKKSKLAAPRGLILDREGRILVENQSSYEVIVYPQFLSDKEETAQAISNVIEMPREKILRDIKKSRRQNGIFFPVKIKKNLSREEVFKIKRLRMHHPGLDIREVTQRSYPLEKSGSQLFGYVSEISRPQIDKWNKKYEGELFFEPGDIIGQFGLEKQYEQFIYGTNGVSFVQVDARGRQAQIRDDSLLGHSLNDVPAKPGNSIILTIDKDIQQAAWDAFVELERIGGAIVMKTNGEILAWVSRPAFDPNDFAAGISRKIWASLRGDPFKPLRNKVIQDHNPPGSTFKPFVALAALQEEVITPATELNCPGYIVFGRRRYHDWNRAGHGTINVLTALERSSNVFFYRMGMALKVDKMFDYISLLGLGQLSNLEFPQETKGLLPNRDWKLKTVGEPWQPGENLSMSIGQGFVISTPIQMARAYSIIGREGEVFQPQLIKKVISPEQKTIAEFSPKLLDDISQPKEGRKFIKKEHFRTVKEGLRRVVQGDRGTARRVRVPGFEIAGKTGTAQVRSFKASQIYKKCKERPMKLRHHGWFTSFAPVEKPEIAIAVFAEHSCSGSGGAAPIAKKIYDAYFEKHYPERFKEGKEKFKEEQRRRWLALKKQKEEEERKKLEEASDQPLIDSEVSENDTDEQEQGVVQ